MPNKSLPAQLIMKITVTLVAMVLLDCGAPEQLHDETSTVAQETHEQRSEQATPAKIDEDSQTEPEPPSNLPTTETIGLAAVPASLTPEQREKLRAALKIHSTGDHKTSQKLFEAMVEESPESMHARYNLACAKSLNGDLDGAALLLEKLLWQDLPHYRRRLATDSDLAFLRESQNGAELQKTIANLEKIWREGAQKGLPITFWGQERSTVDGRPVDLRAGVYLLKERRILPLGERSRNAIASTADAEHEVSLTIRYVVGKDSSVIKIRSRPLFGENDTGVDARLEYPVDAEVTHSKGGFYARVLTEPLGLLKNMRWKRYSTTSKNPVEVRGYWPDRHSLLIQPPGTDLLPPGFRHHDGKQMRTGDFAVHGNLLRLPQGAPIKMSHGHGLRLQDTVHAIPGTSIVFVNSTSENAMRQLCGHIIDRVDIESREVTLISRGPGFTTGRIGPDGAFYLQIGERTHRFDPPTESLDEAEVLPERVGLIVPRCRKRSGGS